MTKNGKVTSVAGVAQRARTQDAQFRKEGKSFIKDGLTNFVAQLGIGVSSQLSSNYYTFDYLTRNRLELEAAYRTAWFVGAAVDVPAEDMTRAGIEIGTSLPPEDIENLNAAIRDFMLWQRLAEAIRWARLFGGCIAVMLIDGQDVSTPLKIDSITEGQFKGLLILDRWLVQPSLNNLVTEMGPDLGLPKFYNVTADAQALAAMKIHHTRVLRFEGIQLPYYQRLVENGWGESVIERIHDRLVAFDSGTLGAAQLLYKAYLRTYSVDGLRELVSAGGDSLANLSKQIAFMRQTQSNEGITLIDASDKFETHTYTFAGISDVLLQLAQQLAGALQIPLIRLLGQSPAGLNSTGESDLRTYYDGIARQQETMLRRPLTRLLDVLCRSVLGSPAPKGFTFKFNPLWQMSAKEKADTSLATVQAVTTAYGEGILRPDTALKELRQSAEITGIFSNISDEEIKAAENLPPPGSEALEDGDTDAGNEGAAGKSKSGGAQEAEQGK